MRPRPSSRHSTDRGSEPLRFRAAPGRGTWSPYPGPEPGIYRRISARTSTVTVRSLAASAERDTTTGSPTFSSVHRFSVISPYIASGDARRIGGRCRGSDRPVHAAVVELQFEQHALLAGDRHVRIDVQRHVAIVVHRNGRFGLAALGRDLRHAADAARSPVGHDQRHHLLHRGAGSGLIGDRDVHLDVACRHRTPFAGRRRSWRRGRRYLAARARRLCRQRRGGRWRRGGALSSSAGCRCGAAGVRGICGGPGVAAARLDSAERGSSWVNVGTPSTALAMRMVAMAFTVTPGRRRGR